MATTTDGPPPAESHNVLSIGTAQELEQRKSYNQNKELFVYGFTSKDYPQTCGIMSRTFRKLSVDPKFKDAAAFFEMDIEKFQNLAQKYKLDVYPAFLLLNPKDTDNEVGARVTGMNPGKLESSIQKALNKLRAPPVVSPRPPAVSSLQPFIYPVPPGRRRPALSEHEQDQFNDFFRHYLGCHFCGCRHGHGYYF